MEIRVLADGHGYMYSSWLGMWILVRCDCDVTSPKCPHHSTLPRGALKAKRRKANYSDELRFEEKLQFHKDCETCLEQGRRYQKTGRLSEFSR